MTGDRLSDAALMRQVAGGDSAACRHVVDTYLGRAVSLAYRMLGDRTAAEDTAQDAFLRLWREAQGWTPQARIGTWLYRVVHNLCIDQLRRRRFAAEDAMPELADTAAGPMALRHRAQVAYAVEAAIMALPERQRTAITLVHFHETGNIEAADIMDVSVEALESLLARARRALRARLVDRRADLLEDF